MIPIEKCQNIYFSFSMFQRGRGRRAALSEISDEQAARYITQLLHEYEQALQQ